MVFSLKWSFWTTVGLFLFLYPVWDILLVGIHAVAGDHSALLHKGRYVVGLILLGLIAVRPMICGMTSVIAVRNATLLSLAGVYAVWAASGNDIGLVNLGYIWITATLFALASVPEKFETNRSAGLAKSSVCTDGYVTLVYVALCVIVGIVGLAELALVSDAALSDLGYYRRFAEAKGIIELKASGYFADWPRLPANIHSQIAGVDHRRMVSTVGQPLYLAYFLVPAAGILFACIFLPGRRSDRTWSAVGLGIVGVSLVLALSRFALAAAGVGIVGAAALLGARSRVAGPATVLLCGLGGAGGLLAIVALAEIDASVRGHITSFVSGLKGLSPEVVLYPHVDHLFNNFVMRRTDRVLGSESGAVILWSSFGGVLTMTLGLAVIARLRGMVRTSARLSSDRPSLNLACSTCGRTEVGLVVVYPWVLVGYLCTLPLAPHILTFKMLFFLTALSLTYGVAEAHVRENLSRACAVKGATFDFSRTSSGVCGS